MMVLRTQLGYLYKSFSNDAGVTWTKAESMGIVSPLSPATVKRIPKTGHLLLVWNNAPQSKDLIEQGSASPRTPLTTAISKDEARTWQHVQNLECDKRFAFAYTSVLFDGDWTLLSYFVHQRALDLVSMKVALVETDWFYQ